MKRIAVFTSGGDSPGMNACIRATVRGALYYGLDIYGIRRGYDGMIKGDIFQMYRYSVSNIIQRGGTILKSARSKDFMTKEGRKKAFDELKKHEIEGLVAIGGNGTFTGAKIFFEEYGIPTVGAPGTIDNDLYGTDFTIGYDTAVNTALDAIDKIRDTADSHDRIFFVEVMGRDSGYIAIQSGIGGGAELVMVPETFTPIEEVITTLREGWKRNKTSAIIVVAEGETDGTLDEIANQVRRTFPQADIRVTKLGHIQRGGGPSSSDRILGSRLGLAAVEGLINGQNSVMAGILNNEVVYTPFGETIRSGKPISEDLIRLVGILS
jgi:6-phosphofructokinase 1